MNTTVSESEKKSLNWVRMTEDAGWQPRDSSGEVAFRGRMWLFGGWFNSYLPCPRDVWSSPDGANWTLVQERAPWKHSDLPMTLTFDERMWFMGGWYNGRLPGHCASNEVWASRDGAEWERVTECAGWSPRIAAGAVVFKDKMWILGGIENYFFGDNSSLRNDVWCSPDGKTWELATENAEWSPRAYHQVAIKDERIWVLGGGNYTPEHHALNDVWCSEDGAHWTQMTKSAPWGPRLWFSAVTYRERVWVLGGWSKAHDNFGDVWYSADGETWSELESDVVWKARHEHSTYVFKDRIWVAGGHARPLSNDVWYLEVPEDW